jgi:acetylornithine deacetylase/succinyl-diaminopimelate desuccinylase-like protein
MTAPEKLLRELIALPSVNPAFMPPHDPRAGEKLVAEFLAATAANAGLDVELQPVFPERSNLLARLTPPRPIRQRVVLAPHTDTVGEPAMPDTLFQPTKKSGRIYGRGACDTKGSVAAMLCALMAVAGRGIRPQQTEILLVAFVDEEHGQAGSRALVESGFRADLAIVGEPTRLQVITAHKGAAWLTIETRGQAAHGAKPELGRNAVHEMAKVVDLLETRYAAQLKKRRHPLLGRPTVNVGFIQGGRQANIVPDRCVIEVDRRAIPGESNASVRREVSALLKQHGLTAVVKDSKSGLPCLPLETKPSLPLVKQLFAVTGQSDPMGVDYFSDASILAHGGTPSVLFGPGDIAQAHRPDEWIALASLEQGTALLTEFLRSLP